MVPIVPLEIAICSGASSVLQPWFTFDQECAMPVLIETRHIEAILALAEELSFTRAATRIHQAQSSLSRQIEQLEEIVGFPICDRSCRGVVFTDAGQELVDEFRRAVQHIKLGVHRGQMTHEGKEHLLLVGHSPYTDHHLLSLLLKIRLPQFPHLKVETDTHVAPVLMQKLLDGALNMAIITCPPATETVLFTPLSSSPLYAVMPEHHPAASKEYVSLADFADDTWIAFQESAHPVLYHALMDQVRAHGFSIRELHHILTPQEVIHMVNSGVGISFATQALARDVYEPNLVCRPLVHEQLTLETHTAIRRGDDSKLVNAFARAFQRRYKDEVAKVPTLSPS
jgi:DNA-binding transcriptional LysR family regulator